MSTRSGPTWSRRTAASCRTPGQHCYCVYAGRRDCYRYVHSHEEVMQRYGKDMVMCERMPEMMVPQMGNQMYTVKLPSQQATEEFIHFVQDR